MDKIKRFFECLIPVTLCNLRCAYCYVIQENRRTERQAVLKYPAERIGNALAADRLGGVCWFSVCGAGETLLCREIYDIVYRLLQNGHYVNITTNGTISRAFQKFAEMPGEFLRRLHFSFSLHYLEMVRTNTLRTFFDNIRLVKSLGCSYFTQINVYDDYIPHLEEIKRICLREIHEIPQLVATRQETSKQMSLHTSLNKDEYRRIGTSYDSPLFNYTIDNFMVKRREFCYAGDWSGVLDLSTGILKRCYASGRGTNIFEDIKRPIVFEAVGKNCGSLYCMNSSHFLSLGCIPEIMRNYTYASLRNRGGYTETMLAFLSGKLIENNREYGFWRKLLVTCKGKVLRLLWGVLNRGKRIKDKIMPPPPPHA